MHFRILIFLLVCCNFQPCLWAQVTSTFSVNVEGWTASDINFTDPKVVTFNSSGGNPGGYVSTSYPSNSYIYWTSPTKFAGNRAYTSYGKTLSFDIQINGTPSFHGPSYGDVILRRSNGAQLIYTLPSYPASAPAWSTFSVTLDTNTPWRNNATNGAIATKTDIIDVLTDLTHIRINTQYGSTTVCGLDNVILETKAVLPPPSISSITPMSAQHGEEITIEGSNFNSAANTVVRFGSLKGQVVTASSTQLKVVVPPGATYGFISVEDITTGLSDQSSAQFIPTFEDGGRIIHASFKNKVDILVNSSSPSLHFDVGDIDGDGWQDIVAAEQSVPQLVVFRNKGLGGDISMASFDTKFPIALPRTGKVYLKVADLDNDGKSDIVCTTSDGFYARLDWFRNTSTSGNISFEPVEELLGPGYSDGPVLVSDLDQDGRPDIIYNFDNSCGGAGAYVSIYQNMSSPGNIEFTSFADFDFGLICQAGEINAADLTGDGKPELGILGNFSNTIHIFENTSTPGSISFNTPFAIGPAQSKGSVMIADFDNDGKKDVGWSYYSTEHIKLIRNNYSGGVFSAASFEAPVVLTSPLNGTFMSSAPADINGDGKTDIVLLTSSNLVVLENNSTPGTLNANSFIYGTPFKSEGVTYPTGPVIADINRDGKADILGGTNSTPRVYIHQNNNFHMPVISLNTVSPLAGPVGTTVTITGDHFSTTLTDNRVFFGTVEAPVLTATKTQLTVSVPAGAQYAPVSVTRNRLTSAYHLPFNVTFASTAPSFDASSFSPPVSFTLTAASNEVMAGDLNNDGKLDIVAGGNSFDTYIFKNTHTTGAISSSSLQADDSVEAPGFNHLPTIKDLDGDGKPDLVTYDGQMQRNVSTAGEINFEPRVGFSLNSYDHAFGDLNLDGKIDLVGSTFGANTTRVTENHTREGAFVLDGPFSSFEQPSVAFTKPAQFGGTVVVDFDNDGRLDFASLNATTDNFTVWRNNGSAFITTASFTSVGEIPSGDNPAQIISGDLDVDGKADLMLIYSTGTSSGIFTVYRNTSTPGNISFVAQDYTIGSNGGFSAIGDLDGDGKPEIIVPSQTSNVFRIFKNSTAPGTISPSSFTPSPIYAVTAPRGVAIGDLNFDSKPEIIITSVPNELLVFENLVPIGPSITINPQPLSTSVCDGATTNFTLTASGTTNLVYQWQKFDGSVFNNITNTGGYNGTTTSTLQINTAGNFGAGDYRCKVSGDLAPDKFSATVTLTVNAVPAAPATIGASDCVPSSLTLTASGASNGQYRWYDVQTGGTAISGQVNSTYATPVLSTTTTYYAAVNNGLCESTRTPVLATIAPLAKPTITFDPPIFNAGSTINLCEGDVQNFSAPDGFEVYSWSNGESTQEITIDQAGTYSVIVEDDDGCVSPPSDPLNVIINPYPIAEITANGSQLIASSGDSYQWHQNGTELSGETGSTFDFNVLEYGEYLVEVTDNGCTTASDPYVYLITASETLPTGWKVYPNPFHEALFIEAPTPEDYKIDVIDLLGRTVKSLYGNNKQMFHLNQLQEGKYVMKISSSKQSLYFRINKTQ